MRRYLLAILLGVLADPGAWAGADALTLDIEVTGGKSEQRNVPASAALLLPKLEKQRFLLKRLESGGQRMPGQLLPAGIMLESRVKPDASMSPYELHWIIPRLKPGARVAFQAVLVKGVAAAPIRGTNRFAWKTGDDHTDLTHGMVGSDRQRPILRYMHKPYDDSSPAARNRSYKVFHHVFNPAGTELVTNGGHTDSYDDEKQLLYPHHRGLQFGFNKCIYENGKKRADTWHCQKDDHQSHEKLLQTEAGPVLGRHRVAIDWHGPGKTAFAHEERELTVYNVPGGTLVEFASRLRPTAGPVKLDGDPQHAGFQFRARNDVATRTSKQTYYLRPDGKGEPGATRNWEPKTKEGPINLPWNAMSFVLGKNRYTVCYLDHPENPGERRWSERDYGRFGCYFEYDLTKDRPLLVNYRIWLQDGEMTGAQVQTLWQQFAHPPKVVVK